MALALPAPGMTLSGASMRCAVLLFQNEWCLESP